MIWLLNPPYPAAFIREGRCQQPPGLFQTIYPPLTLATLASVLRNKHRVKVIDAVALNYSLQKLKNLYLKDKPELVFVNSSTPTIKTDLTTIDELYKLKKSGFLVFGVHATYFANELSKKNRHIKFIKGLPYDCAYRIIGQKYDFSKPLVPSWDLIDLSRYRLPLRNRKFVMLQTSYGCPYRCSFCTVPFYYGKKVRYKPLTNVISEIKYAKSLGVNYFLFFSETFTLNRDYVKKLCREMIKQNLRIHWMCNSRADTIDRETLLLMRKAGCWLISFGIESGNQAILDKCKKRIALEQIKKAVSYSNSLGLLTFGHFILGLEGETPETVEQTILFSKRLNLDFAAFYIATPFPGSPLYEKYKQCIKSLGNLAYSRQTIKTNLNLEKYQKKAYVEFYLRGIPLRRIVKILHKIGLKNIFALPIYLFRLMVIIAKRKY